MDDKLSGEFVSCMEVSQKAYLMFAMIIMNVTVEFSFAMVIMNVTVEFSLTNFVTVMKGKHTQWSLLLPAQHMHIIIICNWFCMYLG